MESSELLRIFPIVTFREALLLKELGFDYPVCHFYLLETQGLFESRVDVYDSCVYAADTFVNFNSKNCGDYTDCIHRKSFKNYMHWVEETQQYKPFVVSAPWRIVAMQWCEAHKWFENLLIPNLFGDDSLAKAAKELRSTFKK
jgi:hypothetical protein